LHIRGYKNYQIEPQLKFFLSVEPGANAKQTHLG